MQFHLEKGTSGLVPAGTTGESPNLTAEEKQLLFETVVEAVNGKIPVIAGSGGNSTAHSLEMTRLAIQDVEGFEVDDREVLRDGPTYTADTLASFPADEELFVILGADAAAGLKTWERYEDVVARATIVVVPRPGTDSTAVALDLPQAVFLDMSVLEVSGTDIRAMAREGRPYRFLVAESVYRYIEDKRLYVNPGEADNVGGPGRMEESS